MNETDLDYLIDDSTNKNPCYKLWLTVLLDAVLSYIQRQCTLGESFIFDPDNEFFDFVAETMGYSPDKLRNRIKKAGKELASTPGACRSKAGSQA